MGRGRGDRRPLARHPHGDAAGDHQRDGEATEVSVACYRAAGTTAVLESQPFERRFRDALCISQHLQATPAHLEMVGRHLLGVPQAAQFV
ncbi:hypothetical protein ACFQY5_21435 [Paeniroseomonas aquatica]|uniref:hypothetical protein n=1 Tax=Paeniroseomonas aquatica TaxID=373043 RepID=UPI00361D0F96